MLVTVNLIKPAKDTIITYQAQVLQRDSRFMLLHARWDRDTIDIGFVTFELGDHLYEYFYTDRWYNIYELQAPDGTLKGWYCNITRPALFYADMIESEDLELDLFVSPDRQHIHLLDEDEYAARGIAGYDPDAHHAALAAVDELRDLAMRGVEAFAGYA